MRQTFGWVTLRAAATSRLSRASARSVARQPRVQRLERDDRSQQAIFDLVHLAHRPDAEQPAHVIAVRDQHPGRQHRRAQAIGKPRAARAGVARRLADQLRAAIAVREVTIHRAALRTVERAGKKAHHTVLGETAIDLDRSRAAL